MSACMMLDAEVSLETSVWALDLAHPPRFTGLFGSASLRACCLNDAALGCVLSHVWVRFC